MKLSYELILAMLGLAGLAGGCNRDESVTVQRVPKDPPKALAGNAPAPEMQRAEAEETIQWTVPAGWKAMPAGQMRYAVFAVSEGEKPVVLTVIPLPPQPLLPNVNRWEQQLDLPPTKEAELGKVVTHLDVNGVGVDVVDLTGPKPADGPQQRMLAAMISRGGKTWFFKMVGAAEIVGAQKGNFDAFIKSIRFVSGEEPKAEAKAEVRIGHFEIPQGWQQVTDVQPPRMLMFTMGPKERQAELVVTKFGPSVGDLPSNVNRWRGQVGLEPTQDMSAYQPQKVTLGGAEAPMFEVVGPESAGAERKRMLVVIASVADEMWFFKLLGPAEEVAKEKPAFVAFLKSVQFVGQKP